MFREHLLLLKRLFPQYTRVVDAALEDVEDLDVETNGTPYQRIFRAIDEGYQLRSEIARKTGIDPEELKAYLKKMVAAGTLRTEEQGGKTDGARGARKTLYFRASLKPAALQTTKK